VFHSCRTSRPLSQIRSQTASLLESPRRWRDSPNREQSLAQPHGISSQRESDTQWLYHSDVSNRLSDHHPRTPKSPKSEVGRPSRRIAACDATVLQEIVMVRSGDVPRALGRDLLSPHRWQGSADEDPGSVIPWRAQLSEREPLLTKTSASTVCKERDQRRRRWKIRVGLISEAN
jgi:hypothetical protein